MKITQRFFIPLFLSLASCSLAGEVSQNLQDGVVFVNEDAGGAIIQNKKISSPTYIKQNDNLIKETFKRDDDFSKGWNRTKNGVNTPVIVDILCNVSRGRVIELFPKGK